MPEPGRRPAGCPSSVRPRLLDSVQALRRTHTVLSRETAASRSRSQAIRRETALIRSRSRVLSRGRIQVRLARDQSSAAHLRGLIEDHLAGQPAAIVETVKLVAGELVDNAYRHGEGDIRLRLALHRDRLRIDVVDDGAAADAVRVDEGQRGLKLVEDLSVRWGSREGSTHVWAEIAIASRSPSPPPDAPH